MKITKRIQLKITYEINLFFQNSLINDKKNRFISSKYFYFTRKIHKIKTYYKDN